MGYFINNITNNLDIGCYCYRSCCLSLALTQGQISQLSPFAHPGLLWLKLSEMQYVSLFILFLFTEANVFPEN